jgi:hypothetical protein
MNLLDKFKSYFFNTGIRMEISQATGGWFVFIGVGYAQDQVA